MAKPQTPLDTARSRLVTICGQISSGSYEEAKALFDLPLIHAADEPTRILLEALDMMMVRIEAREFERDRLMAEILSAREELEKHRARLAVENRRLRERVHAQAAVSNPFGESAAMRSILAQAERMALTKANLLLTGETGSGKGLLARHIHEIGPRAGKAFVTVNCAAIPDSLLESELLGIEAGVASGVQARVGRFEQASGGTILLDEIGDMPLESQAKILHVIENGVVERVGGRKRVPIDTRVIAATHRDLERLVEQKTFREDLFYRLNIMRLHIPPLRERPDDIPSLTRRILADLADGEGHTPRRVSAETLRLLTRYPWPGNIRELRNALERAALLADGDRIVPADLPPSLLAGYEPEEKETLPPPVSAPQVLAAETGGAEEGFPPDIRTLEEVESAHILNILARHNGNKSRAARALGISREGLRVRLARLSG
jgi:DNA-binding NtrC family response regulator